MATRRLILIVVAVLLLMALMIPAAGAVSTASSAAAKIGAEHSQTLAVRGICPHWICPFGLTCSCSSAALAF